MGYSDKYVQLPVIEFNSTEEVKNDDGSVSVTGACSIYYTYINPFDIVRFETHEYSQNITALYLRSCLPIAIDMSCEKFMDLLDSHVGKS